MATEDHPKRIEALDSDVTRVVEAEIDSDLRMAKVFNIIDALASDGVSAGLLGERPGIGEPDDAVQIEEDLELNESSLHVLVSDAIASRRRVYEARHKLRTKLELRGDDDGSAATGS